jgi:hypothetical protein
VFAWFGDKYKRYAIDTAEKKGMLKAYYNF